MAISKITKPFRYYKVNTGNEDLIIYKAADIVTIRRISVIIFANSQTGGFFAIHLFTGGNGNELTAKWLFNSNSAVLTPRVELMILSLILQYFQQLGVQELLYQL